MDEKELLERIGRAKALIDNGFSRAGPSLRADDEIESALFSASCRAARLANASVVLCRQGHAPESLALVRELSAVAVVMRDLLGRPHEERIARIRRLRQSGVALWEEADWPLWLERAGFDESSRRTLDRAVFSQASAFAASHAGGLPWSHVFKPNGDDGAGPQQILEVIAMMLEHAVQTLRRQWPEAFSGGEAP